MQNIKLIFIAGILLLKFNMAEAQSNEAKSQAYYYTAQEQYDAGNYTQALELLDKSAEVGGATNAYIEALRAQCYAQTKNWIEAKKALEKCFSMGPSNEVLRRISSLTVEVDSQYEQAVEAERQKAIANKKAEEERLRKEQENRLAAQRLENRKNNVAAAMLPEIRQLFYKYNALEEGRPYFLTYRKSLSSSTSEKAYFIFYDDRFIIYTIPSQSVYDKLNKESISFSGYDANYGNDNLISMKLDNYGTKTQTYFRKGIHYSNVFLGGFGDELMWTSGDQYLEFDKTLYYYYYYNTLQCDIEMNTTFQENYYNPYIETGTIAKYVDYDLIKDATLAGELRAKGFRNKATSNLDSPYGLEIELKTSGNIKMIYPQKDIKYKIKDKVKGEYTSGSTAYKGTYLYFTPKSSTSYYGFIQLATSFPGKGLFDAITGSSNTYILSKSYFDNLYESFSSDFGAGTSKYFTSADYNLVYWAINKIAGGSPVSLESLYGSYTAEVYPESNENTSDSVYIWVDELPSFKGGQPAMATYLQQNMVYPQKAINEGLYGKVMVRFVVGKTGKIGSVDVMKGISPDLDAEAKRLVEHMPDWNPGKSNGVNVQVEQIIPITFVLH